MTVTLHAGEAAIVIACAAAALAGFVVLGGRGTWGDRWTAIAALAVSAAAAWLAHQAGWTALAPTAAAFAVGLSAGAGRSARDISQPPPDRTPR